MRPLDQPLGMTPVDHIVVKRFVRSLVASLVSAFSEFMDVLVWEDGSSNDQIVVHTEVNKALTIVVDITTTMCNHDPFKVKVVCSHLRVHISTPTLTNNQIAYYVLSRSGLYLRFHRALY